MPLLPMLRLPMPPRPCVRRVPRLLLLQFSPREARRTMYAYAPTKRTRPPHREDEAMLRLPMPNRTIVAVERRTIPTKRMIKSRQQASSRRKDIGRQLQEDKAMIIESPLQRGPLPSKLPLLPLLRSPPRPIFPIERGKTRSLLSPRLRYRISL